MTNTPNETPRRSRRRTLLLSALAAGAVTAGLLGATVAERRGDGGHRTNAALQRDVDALTALGATGVQARLTGPDGPDATAVGGVADVTTRQPVPADGYFRIASVTKAFVATVVLQLVAEGKLTLDDTVESRLPGVVSGNGNDGRAITVRDLLQHRSGLHDDYPDYTSAEDFQQHRNDTVTAEQTVARAVAHQPDFRPGTQWSYGNTGYVLLGMIVERVTGHPWHQEVHDRIVRPLALDHTSRPGATPALPQPHAATYQRFQDGGPLVDVTEQVGMGTNGEAGLISTTADLDRFFAALLGGKLLPPAQLAQLQQTVPVGQDVEPLMPGARDGLGLFSRPLSCGGLYWGHDGGDSGWITATGTTSDGRRAVTVSLSGVQIASPDDAVRIAAAENTLIDHALCGSD
ncbi:serine hydrolase domain-containing protein [Kitasatospora griseola]|uniref:serine hydrolase domain-containing protein n=1 Tax=Kitasatospora griseola TaxID=2064 RepID=UPI001670F7B9|nr:serine hydrolase domain-containing protein [Kitasatospora griseola]GGQ64166.1 serine hydrolase [Kitasatospora griseola]